MLKPQYDERYALIIGINAYKNLQSLDCAVNDAKSLKDSLIKNFNYKEENIELILDEEATKENIMNKFRSYSKEKNNICRDDSLIVFFAGHGTSIENVYGKAMGYFVPIDGTEFDYNTLIKLDDLIDESQMIYAKHLFFIFDSCYSGLVTNRGDKISKRFLKDLLTRPCRQILTSGKSDQMVKDGSKNCNNSIFTSALLKGLDGAAKTDNGVLSASSLINYVYNEVGSNDYSSQTPGYYTEGEGDFIFNIDELLSKVSSNDGKNNDVLVEIKQIRNEKYDDSFNKIKKFKKLLSEEKNFIEVNDYVNNSLKNYLSSISGRIDTSDFEKQIDFYNQNLDELLCIVILLTFYGDTKYCSLIKKILTIVCPKSGNNRTYLDCYPGYLLYLAIIISSIIGDNISVLKEILELKTIDYKTINYDKKTNLFIIINDSMMNVSNNFSVMSPDINYKYPLSEYLYKLLQVYIDDLLFVGDDYINIYTTAEMVAALYYAIEVWNEKYQSIWSITGRYNYKIGIVNIDVRDMPADNYIKRMGLYKKINDVEEFYKKFNKFLSDKTW